MNSGSTDWDDVKRCHPTLSPGSASLTFPGMRELLPLQDSLPRPVVSFAFSSIDGFKEISALCLDKSRHLLRLHNACVRETLSACGG